MGRWWLQREAIEEVARNLGLDAVPTLYGGLLECLSSMLGFFRDAERHADGLISRWGEFRAEGVVGTPAIPLFARDGSRVIVKLKHKDFDRMRREQS